MRVLVTGASGMVGFAMSREVLSRGDELIACGQVNRHHFTSEQWAPFSLEKTEEITGHLERHRPDHIIHLAAMTNHRTCEEDEERANRLHIDATAELARWASREGARMTHISTEAVYGYNQPLEAPHSEKETCQPEGVYARSKLAGENAALSEHPEALVLRVTPVGWSTDQTSRTLAEWVAASLENQPSDLKGYTDAWFSPLDSFSLAEYVFHEKALNLSGIYNLGCAPGVNKYQFASQLAEALGHKSQVIEPVEGFAKIGPRNGIMNSTRWFKALSVSQPSLNDVIQKLIQRRP